MKTTYPPDTLTPASLAGLVSFEGWPCMSLNQPFHRQHPDSQQDLIRFCPLLETQKAIFELQLDARKKSDAVLTEEQREKLSRNWSSR